MSVKYPALFKPFTIGKLRIKNRIVMSPMALSGRSLIDGNLSDSAIAFYEERAKGGAGLITTGSTVINCDVEKMAFGKSPFQNPDIFLAQNKKLADKIHSYDAKLFVQLGFGAGRAAFPAGLDSSMNGTPVAPSAIPNRWVPSVICRPTTADENKRMTEAFVEAAFMVKGTGADGINLPGFYGGYLFDQFATRAYNKRTDEYGFEQNGQIKLVLDTLRGIKELCGKDYPIIVRITPKHYAKGIGQGGLPGEEYIEYGRDIDESIILTKMVRDAGADAILIGNGSYDSFYWLYPPMYQKDGLWLEDAKKIRDALDIPVICPGKITMPKIGNDAIESGMIDAVAIGRASLADAEWPNKALEGRDEDIRPCIGCHYGCIGRIFSGLPFACAVNAELFEEQYPLAPAAVKVKKKVAVIGGGIAGMEAARVAALRGHTVDLYEKSDYLGGTIAAASVPDFKDADRALLRWYTRQLDKAGVNIHLNFGMDLDKIKALNADEIILAVGATPVIPKIDGMNAGNTVNAKDVLLGKVQTGERCVVIGGGVVGCELALWLADKGKEVTVIEMQEELVQGGIEPLPLPNRLMLIDMVNYSSRITALTDSTVESMVGNTLKVRTPGGIQEVTADTVIIAAGFTADDTLYTSVTQELGIRVWNVGDSRIPVNIHYAVRDGYAVGKNI